jgi:hypothetical protein
MGLDQILPQILKDHFVAKELGWLIVDHQDVDSLVRRHRFFSWLCLPPDRRKRFFCR